MGANFGEHISVDLTPFLAEALATNKALHSEIDRLYQKDKTRYYELAKHSPWYEHSFLTSTSLKTEVYARRALGLLAGLGTPQVVSLLKKGWPWVYKLVSKASSVKADLIQRAIPKSQRDSLTDDEFGGYVVVGLVLGRLLDKAISTDTDTTAICQMLWGRLDHAAGEMRFDYKKIVEERYQEREDARRLTQEVQAASNISPRKGLGILSDTTHPEATAWRIAFEFVFDSEGLAESILDDAPLSEEHLESIAAIYNMCFPDKGTSQAIEFHVAAIYVKRLLVAYRQVKQTFWANAAEVLYPELNNLTQEVAKLREEHTRLAQENVVLREQNAQLQKLAYSEYNRARAESRDAIHQLSAEVGQLKAQVEADRREMAALREMFFDLSKETNVVAISPETDPAPYLANLRGVRGLIVGGHERWQQRMKALLPHFTFIHTDVLNFDPQLIVGVDVVFVHCGYVSHAFYHKVMSALRSYPDVALHYLHGTNPLRILKEMSAAVARA